MKKLLLLFISVLCLGLGAYAETVSFASGALPTGWSGKMVQKGRSRPKPVETPLQILGGGYIQSPEYKNVSSIKVSLNITTKAKTLTIAQSTDKGKTWPTIRTIDSECDPNGWKEFDVATTGDTSNGVMFKLSAETNSYYISSFEYTTYGEDATTVPEAPVISFGETTCTTGETYDIEYGAEVTVSSKDAESIIANSPVETAAEHTGNSYKFKISKSGDYTFKGKNKVGESATTTVTFNVKKPVGSGIVYSLVTSASDLVAGETYTIGCASKGTVMSNATSEDYPQYVEYVEYVDFTTGSFEIKSNMLALTLEQYGDGWKILTQNYEGGNGYFNAVDKSSKNNNLLIDNTGAKWAIEIGEDESHNATISTPDFTNTRYIYWNPSSPRFSAYLKPQTEVQLYRETVVAPTIEVDREVINTTGNVDVHAGSLIRIIGHEANELYYIHTSTTTANRAPVANTEGWTKHDSNIYEYTVPADFATKHITITAKGVKNGKESAPVSITLHNGSTTGIEGVESAENDAEVEWFTITGVRVQQPAEGGLYIRRQGSEVSKVRF